MSEITPEKTHQLLERLADYVMTEVSTKTEVNQKISQVDEKIDKLADYVMAEVSTKAEVNQKISQVDEKIDQLANYVMNEVPTKREIDERLERVEKDIGEVKQNVNLILEGMDAQAKQVEILKTKQTAFNHGFSRLEERVEKLEKVH
jgi:chromosome segregation ATPase